MRTPTPVPWQRRSVTFFNPTAGVSFATAANAPQAVTVALDVPDLSQSASAREAACFLLHTAAEIEHALLAQYLYAAFSLAQPPFAGTPPDIAANLVNKWRGLLLATAREEMGHLITVQNVLRLIGFPLNLEREDMPFRKDFYPFPFTLEPMAQGSLAKYVAAEMPDDPNPGQELQAIIDLATAGAGMKVNPVGVLYATIIGLFSKPEEMQMMAASSDPVDFWVSAIHDAATQGVALENKHLDPQDFLPNTGNFQAAEADWGGDAGVYVRVLDSRESAVSALKEIALQGEGPPPGQAMDANSHFARFLTMYREFPKSGEWQPTLQIPTDPVVPQASEVAKDNHITHPRSQRWAALFDVRYEMLLSYLRHFLEIEEALYVESGDRIGDRTGRGFLNLWAFDEMRRMGKIAHKLGQLPRRTATSDPARAGAPFTMPASLDIAPDEPGRWAKHRDLLQRSMVLIAQMQQSDPTDATDPFLAHLAASDSGAFVIADAKTNEAALPGQPSNFKKVALIVEEGVRGFLVRGAHRSFWRDMKLDAFLNFNFAGQQLIVPADAANSALFKALSAISPFGNDVGTVGAYFPRMPARRPPVHPSRIEYIRQWIDAGCPDSNPPGEVGIGGEPDPQAEPVVAIPPTTDSQPTEEPSMQRFSEVKAILEGAVSSQDIGAHGNFWRDKTRDQFIALSIFGQALLATKADGTFDENESNLVKALQGRAPFGSDVGAAGAFFRRMPAGRPAVPAEQVDVIRQWIKDGCPDDNP